MGMIEVEELIGMVPFDKGHDTGHKGLMPGVNVTQMLT